MDWLDKALVSGPLSSFEWTWAHLNGPGGEQRRLSFELGMGYSEPGLITGAAGSLRMEAEGSLAGQLESFGR